MFRWLAGARTRSKGGLVTVGTVAGLLVAVGATLFGLGAADNAIANFDASSWLFSSHKGEVARVNGVTGRVDTRYKVTDAQGHTVQVTQTDRYVILRDLTTGKVSVLDLATLQVAATTQTTAGIGVTIALQGEAAFVVDAVQGGVSQLDPATLRPVGAPLHFPPGLAGGRFDATGKLWLLVPSEGTVVAVEPAGTASPRSGSGEPRVVRTVPVADPNHDLAISVLDAGVAVLDKTANTLTTLRGDATHTVALPLSGPGAMPIRTAGSDVPVTVVDDQHVYVVTGDKVAEFTVPGASPKLRPCVAWSHRFYCPDEATGTVYTLDLGGHLVGTIAIADSGGVLELEVREGHLFINAPNSSTARVVDDQGRVKVVDKYANNVLGGDPPPNPPPPPPQKPTVGPPGPPSSVTASAGNATARVTWGPAAPNGAPVLKYVVEGDGKAHDVGAAQRGIDIAGLTNGQPYTFTVYAVNAKGAGPKRAANPVVPTAEVPDPPASVTAVANPTGTVTVTWPPANGQGHKVVSYQVTPVSAGAAGQPLPSTGTTLAIPAGTLTYGTQYAFTVVAVNDKGAGSKPSPVSNTVVPFTVPSAPKNVQAVTVDAKGAIQVSWQAADDNGRPITKYVVTAGATSKDVTGTGVTLTGFPDGATVSATVKAVNAAGPGPGVTKTARTIAPPTVTLTGNPGAGYRQITVNFTVNGNGGATTCMISVNNGPGAPVGCTGTTVGGLAPGNAYNYTVTATNKAGSAGASGGQTTPTLYGRVICPNNDGYCNSGIWAYRQPTQSGTAVNPSLPVGTRFAAQCQIGGGNVDARPWGAKNTTVWIRISYNGTAYFPWAWTSLDAGDNLGNLPSC